MRLFTYFSYNVKQIENIKDKIIVIFRLPQDIYRTAKVAKTLLLLEKGKGKEFKGKNLDQIQLEDVFYQSDSEGKKHEENSQHQKFITSTSSEILVENKNTSLNKSDKETHKVKTQEKIEVNLMKNMKKKSWSNSIV